MGGSGANPSLTRKSSDNDDVAGEKNSPYLLPKIKSEGEASSSNATARTDGGLFEKVVVKLTDSLRLRLGLIAFVMWIANVTYR